MQFDLRSAVSRAATRRRHRLAIVLTAALLMLTGCDWTQAGYAGLSFHNPAEPLLTPSTVPSLGKAWAVHLGPGVDHDPIVARGVAVLSRLDAGSGQASLAAHDVATGEARFVTAVAFDATAITDVVALGRHAHVAARRGDGSVELVAVDLGTGAVAWRAALSRLPDVPTVATVELHPRLAIADGRILVARSVEDTDPTSADLLRVDAIEAASGDEHWHLARRSHAPSVIVSGGSLRRGERRPRRDRAAARLRGVRRPYGGANMGQR